MKKIMLLFFCLALFSISDAQLVHNFGRYDSTYNAGKMRLIGITTATTYVGVIYVLSNVWYKNKTSFHFFNDNAEWKQMDKVGHSVASFHEGKVSLELLKWAGVEKKSWLVFAGMSGFIFQLPIEVLDGYSSDFGASTGDLIANFTGSAVMTSQYLLWGKSYINFKFSYHTSPFSEEKLRPNTLGENWREQLLKDYNGQTYWLSMNLFPLFRKDKLPKWLSVAVGYGAENMLFGSPEDNQANGFKAYRQFYLAPDIDFTRIKTNKKGLKVLFYIINIIHPPLPTLELSRGNLKGRLFYF